MKIISIFDDLFGYTPNYANVSSGESAEFTEQRQMSEILQISDIYK